MNSFRMNRAWRLALTGWCVAILMSAPSGASPPAATLVSRDDVLIIAHRGDSRDFPENTLPAFESAVRVGAELVELDYVHSADGVPLVIHDETLDRTTDAISRFGGAALRVDARNLAELQSLDAGTWFDKKFAGTRLPTLEESLDTIRRGGSMTLIERKAGDALTCVKLLRKKKLIDRVVVQSFDWKFLADCRKLSNEVVLVALGVDPLTSAQLDEVVMLRVAGIGWRDRDTVRETISAAHDRGLKVWVWTVDNPARARELVDWGANGIITNVPGRMRREIMPRP